MLKTRPKREICEELYYRVDSKSRVASYDSNLAKIRDLLDIVLLIWVRNRRYEESAPTNCRECQVIGRLGFKLDQLKLNLVLISAAAYTGNQLFKYSFTRIIVIYICGLILRKDNENLLLYGVKKKKEKEISQLYSHRQKLYTTLNRRKIKSNKDRIDLKTWNKAEIH